MRRMIPTKLQDFIKKLKEILGIEGTKVEFGGNVEIDGKVMVNSKNDFTDKDGTPLEFGGEVTREAIVNASGLVTPLTTPLAEEFVTIDNAGAQSRKGLGDGLIVNGNNVEVDGRVKVIAPPESTTLTDEQIALFRGGVFINGSFLGFTNPIFNPCKVIYEAGDPYYKGNIISLGSVSQYGEGFFQGTYKINVSTKVITFDTTAMVIHWDLTNQYYLIDGKNKLRINGIQMINSKTIPAYPSNTGTFVLKCVNGTLAWVEEA